MKIKFEDKPTISASLGISEERSGAFMEIINTTLLEAYYGRYLVNAPLVMEKIVSQIDNIKPNELLYLGYMQGTMFVTMMALTGDLSQEEMTKRLAKEAN
jgi:hypothetical protein